MVLKSKITKKINPTDKELLRKLKIKKEYFPETNEIFYIVLLNNNEIGSAVYRTNKNVVDSTGIDKEYRRKGINTWLYDYIEKDQNVKLIPSKTLMREGELFWRNRLKRSNPINNYLLSDLEIRKSISYEIMNDPHILYSIYYRYDNKNNLIGKVYVKLGSNSAHVEIHKDFRRQGIASYVYDYVERDLNIKLKPNSNQLDDGKEFWKNRLKKNPSIKPKNARPLKTLKTKTTR